MTPEVLWGSVGKLWSALRMPSVALKVFGPRLGQILLGPGRVLESLGVVLERFWGVLEGPGRPHKSLGKAKFDFQGFNEKY